MGCGPFDSLLLSRLSLLWYFLYSIYTYIVFFLLHSYIDGYGIVLSFCLLVYCIFASRFSFIFSIAPVVYQFNWWKAIVRLCCCLFDCVRRLLLRPFPYLSIVLLLLFCFYFVCLMIFVLKVKIQFNGAGKENECLVVSFTIVFNAIQLVFCVLDSLSLFFFVLFFSLFLSPELYVLCTVYIYGCILRSSITTTSYQGVGWLLLPFFFNFSRMETCQFNCLY